MTDSDGDLRAQGPLSRAAQRAKAYSTGELGGRGALYHASQRAHAERARRAELAEALRREAGRTDLIEDDPERALVRDAIRELVIPALDAAKRTGMDFTMPPISTPPGRPKKHLLRVWAQEFKAKGLSYAKISLRLNRGYGVKTTAESVRKLLRRS